MFCSSSHLLQHTAPVQELVTGCAHLFPPPFVPVASTLMKIREFVGFPSTFVTLCREGIFAPNFEQLLLLLFFVFATNNFLRTYLAQFCYLYFAPTQLYFWYKVVLDF